MFFKTIPLPLNLLVLSASIMLLLKIFIFNSIPEIFNGAHELGAIFEGILGSVIASYVFYLIVVHIKEINDKRIIYPHIIKWARLVVGDCKSQLDAFEKQSNIKLPFQSLTEDQINQAFKKINPKSNAPLVFSLNNYANWIQYFDYNKNRSKKFLAKIMSQLIFLEANLVSLITKIDDCSHFSVVESLIHYPFNNQDMSAFSNTFFEYCIYSTLNVTYKMSYPMCVRANKCINIDRFYTPRQCVLLCVKPSSYAKRYALKTQSLYTTSLW